jgi:hypothetical protein
MTLPEAVQAWDARLGVARAPGALAILDDLDPAIAGATADLLAALLSAAELRDAAYAGIADADILRLTSSESSPEAAALAERVDTARVKAGAALLAQAVQAAMPSLEAYRAALPAVSVVAAAPPVVNLPPVLVLDPFGVASLYTKDAVLALDVGGDDTYDMNAGGSIIGIGPTGDSSTYQVNLGLLAVGGEFEDATVSITAALALDLQGNDHYGVRKAPRPGSDDDKCTNDPIIRRIVIQGSGSGGIGMLVDALGDDAYDAKTLGQGEGHIGGVGVLVELAGNDHYTAIRDAQGAGVLGGAGFFVDALGDDTHIFAAPAGGQWNVDSIRCDATARLGLGGATLASEGTYVDLAGADTYRIGSEGLGFGATAFGAFADLGGAVDDYGGFPARGNNQQVPSAGGVFVDA